ncbi:MAG: hypothetical protein A3J74_11495 [Elusimicrobia bacterium RIFCSPHIGHO2_02_FULL_57_9]|nr:MAG: hypothetical protein A3J74_11495 [Elusimicrobia bacterium RIFCSPHIGHO2_02_FULL_57_9]
MAKKVLVVDDDRAFLGLIQDLLQSQNFEVITAVNGKDAVDLARTCAPDLVLVDYLMPPGPSGMEVLKVLKSDPKLQAIPVILCSSTKNTEEDGEMAKAAGAYGYIFKPFRGKEFISFVKTAMAIDDQSL